MRVSSFFFFSVSSREMFVVPYQEEEREKGRRIQKRETINNEKIGKKQRKRNEKRNIVYVCAFCSATPKRRTERIIFCCRPYVASPIFFSIIASVCYSLVYIFVSHGLLLHVPHMHIFSFFFPLSSVFESISRENEER